MSALELLLYGQLGASLVMALAWVHALMIKNTSYVDVLWGYGVGVLGFIYLVLPMRIPTRQGWLYSKPCS